MPDPVAYEYAVLRVVPRVDREEFVNAGVIVFARQSRVLAMRAWVDEGRLRALWPEVDVESVRRHLRAVERICAGDGEAGPIARLSQSERFHWLTAPRSAMVQVSPVRTGITDEVEGVLGRLVEELLGG